MSEKEVEVEVKKQKISHIQVDILDQQKLYYIHRDIVDKDFTSEYTIYRLDLSHSHDNPVPIPSPLITLERNKYPFGIGFGALGSKIYIFGGFWYDPTVDDDCTKMMSTKDEHSLDVYIFDTSLPVPSLTHGPPLNSPKYAEPVVIPLQGKLYVMPRSPRCEKDGARSVMEVLDPIAKCWSVIEFPSKMWDLVSRAGYYLPLEIKGYGVRGSEILLSLQVLSITELGDLVYNTETSEWVIKQFNSQLKIIPFPTGSFFKCDIDDIWYAFFNPCGRLTFHDVTLCVNYFGDLDYEEHGGIDLMLSDLSCSHPEPYFEDARIIKLSAPGFVLVVSRCWMKPKDRSFEVRVHVLKLSFERSSMHSKARIRECEVLKCISFMRPLVTDDPKKTLSLRGMSRMWRMPLDYCFFI